jgi:hypothetical protein
MFLWYYNVMKYVLSRNAGCAVLCQIMSSMLKHHWSDLQPLTCYGCFKMCKQQLPISVKFDR